MRLDGSHHRSIRGYHTLITRIHVVGSVLCKIVYYIFFTSYLITVSEGLVRTIHWDTNIFRLLSRQSSELGTQRLKVKTCDLLVQLLGKNVNLSGLVLSSFLLGPELDLGKGLVGERARHDERRVAGGTSQVKKTSLSKNDNTASVLEDETINLGLDVDTLGDLHQTSHINFVIEVTNVSNNGVVLHLAHVVSHEDSLVTSGGDENISSLNNILKSADGESLHTGLKSTDGVNLSDVNDTSIGTHGGGTSLTNISVSADNGLLSSHHNIGGTHDTIGE